MTTTEAKFADFMRAFAQEGGAAIERLSEDERVSLTDIALNRGLIDIFGELTEDGRAFVAEIGD